MSNTINRLNETGITALVTSARRGDHTMPDDVMDVFAALERAASVKLPKEDELERLAGDVFSALGGRSTELIDQHIKPALDEFMSDFRTDLATVGQYATELTPPVALLTESEEMRRAYTRLASGHPRYTSIRSSWKVLRSRDGVTTDPLGTDSLLAEVRNLPELVADWRVPAGYWLWSPTTHHVRMAWIIANGGEVWCPTTLEQNRNWEKYSSHAKPPAQQYAW